MNLRLDQLPSLPFAERRKFPACAAVYFALTAEGKVLYVGKSISLNLRLKSHHRRLQFEQYDARVAWLETPVKQLAKMESVCIACFEPTLNRTPVLRNGLQVLCTLVPETVKEIVEKIATQEDRSTSQVVRRLLEESPRIKTALRSNGRPRAVDSN